MLRLGMQEVFGQWSESCRLLIHAVGTEMYILNIAFLPGVFVSLAAEKGQKSKPTLGNPHSCLSLV